MAEFKCINCGTIADNPKDGKCPACGYQMFKLPYDRKQVLIAEIQKFIVKAQQIPQPLSFLKNYRSVVKENKTETILKKDDDNRFPNYVRIKDYVTSSESSEMFFKRLNGSLIQIKKYFNENYTQNYKIDYNDLDKAISQSDKKLATIMKFFGVSSKIDKPGFPVTTLNYQEYSDPKNLEVINQLIAALIELADKTQFLIKKYNVFGCEFDEVKIAKFKIGDGKNQLANLNLALDKVNLENKRTVVIDIMSDGAEEIDPIFAVIWGAINCIYRSPLLKHYEYHFADGTIVAIKDLNDKLKEINASRYSKLNTEINSPDFLSDLSEDKIYELYEKAIVLNDLQLGVEDKEGNSEKELNKLIGLKDIKTIVKKIKTYALVNKKSKDLNLHMCFYGNPGTGKTEVARIIAKILYENKVLPTAKVVEVSREGLIAGYIGQTAIKTQEKINEAMGGVLFVDEAYALVPKHDMQGDYGNEAIATLIKAMEDYRGKFCVILAGYKNEMISMLNSNPGFSSRIQFTLDFPNYNRDELSQIAQLMLNKQGYQMPGAALDKILDLTDIKRKQPNFANAREIRNILDQVIMCQNLRARDPQDKNILLHDVDQYFKDSKLKLPKGNNQHILTGQEELDQLVGLETIKKTVMKIAAYASRNKNDDSFNLHMCFSGNPGTGKTEVARILSRIFYDNGVLAEAKMIETDPYGLIGKYVGETAPKTLDKINEAMNGVLFIDEAYGLVGSNTLSGSATNYGAEAITVLIKEMEDHRGQFCVIFAGYKNEMKNLISSNPGLESRIQFSLDFPDYTRSELKQIAILFLTKKGYQIDDEALNMVIDLTDYYRSKPNFANARTLRKILDQVVMNQNLRTKDNDTLITSEDVQDYLNDLDLKLEHLNQ